VLDVDLENVNALNGLGLAYTGLRSYDNAIDNFNLSLNINPNKVETINGIGFAYYRNSEYEKAESYYREALVKDEDNPYTLNGLILVLTLQDKFEEMESLLTKVDQRGQFIVVQMIKEGKYLNSIGEFNTSSLIFENALLIEPNNIDALYGNAVALKELKKYDDLGYFIDRILDLDEQHIDAIALKEFMNAQIVN